MHYLAIELQSLGHVVTGSDDEIYDPAKSNLQEYGLLPAHIGWDAARISADIDVIILGMHAHEDNPELLRAKQIGLKVESFPSFMYEAYKAKQRIVVTGSHGKTTVSAMIVHALTMLGHSIDFLVGGDVANLDRMVKITDSASVAVIEGDEYLCSRIHRYPKMLAYKGNIIVLTGIEWDHINVFPTFDTYVDQFRQLIAQMKPEDVLIYYKDDENVLSLVSEFSHVRTIPYVQLAMDKNGVNWYGQKFPIELFGQHNLANMHAALLALAEVNIKPQDFLQSMATFNGAGRRLQLIHSTHPMVYYDYAHAPSKVRATVRAIADKYMNQSLLAVYELHTYSSMKAEFISHYDRSLDRADAAWIFVDEKSFAIKRMPVLTDDAIRDAFGYPNLCILRSSEELKQRLVAQLDQFDVILLMTSGTFGGWDIEKDFKELENQA